MAAKRVDRLDDEELVIAFAEAAKALGEAINYWLPTAKEVRRLFAVKKVLRARGALVRLKLVPLLADPNRFVQYYAALHLEGLMPERCREIIERNAKQGDAIAGDAGMHMYLREAGIGKPD